MIIQGLSYEEQLEDYRLVYELLNSTLSDSFKRHLGPSGV